MNSDVIMGIVGGVGIGFALSLPIVIWRDQIFDLVDNQIVARIERWMDGGI